MDAVSAEAVPADAGEPIEVPPRTKLCGRCRAPTECDPEDRLAAGVSFWLCPACHNALLGGTGRGRRRS
ncbi:MAG: hypothetical protein ACRDZ3_13815 [Acidimicrobiia bacterium]